MLQMVVVQHAKVLGLQKCLTGYKATIQFLDYCVLSSFMTILSFLMLWNPRILFVGTTGNLSSTTELNVDCPLQVVSRFKQQCMYMYVVAKAKLPALSYFCVNCITTFLALMESLQNVGESSWCLHPFKKWKA